MFAFKFLSELGRMNIATLIFLQLLLTHDAVSMRGFNMEEVVLADPPCPTCEEIVCTVATIEPPNSDLMYKRQIVDNSQVVIWYDASMNTTFDECAAAAAASGSQMFLFIDGQCKITPMAFETMDQCTVNQMQMVYIEVEAVATPNISLITTYGADYIFVPDYKAVRRESVAECDKFFSAPCAPKPNEDISAYLAKLEEVRAAIDEYLVVGLYSNDAAATFTWTTGVNQPTSPKGENGWGNDFPNTGRECGLLTFQGLASFYCDTTDLFCCTIPL